MAKRSLTYTTGATLKTVIRDFSSGAEKLWNTSTSALEAYNASNIANYGITTTEGSPGNYSWTIPAFAASAVGYEYQATTYQIAATSLATTDLPNSVWQTTFAWDGSLVTVSRALPSVVSATTGGLPTVGTGNGQINPDGTGAIPLAFGTTLPASPVANTVGEAIFFADIIGGRVNTAQGGTSTTITLDASASSDTNAYVGDDIYLYGGTGGGPRGSGQRRTITSYNTSTKVATVQRAWDTTPDNTTTFITLPQPQANVGLWNNVAVGVALPGSGTLSTYAGGAADTDAATILAQVNKIGTNSADSPNAVTAQNTIGTNLTVATSSLATASSVTTAQTTLNTINTQANKIGTNSADSPNAITAQGTISTNLNATVASRSTYAGGPVASVTGNVGGNVVGSVGGVSGVTFPSTVGDATAANQTAIKAKTDLIGTNSADSPNAVTTQSTIGTNLDAAVSSRSAPGSQMDLINVPNTTSVAAIQSGLATASSQTAIKAKSDLIGTNSGDSPNTVTAQGTISTNLNATVSSRSTYSGGAVASVTAPVEVDMTQVVPTSNTGQTLGDALNAARAQGFGKWAISGTTLTLYAADESTVVRTFTLDNATSPTRRS